MGSKIKIALASRNRKKISELETLLRDMSSDIVILSLDDIGFAGEIDENGTTFAQNSLIKAKVPAALGYIGVADDSGLEVDALEGAPGVYSARYSGGGDGENNKKLLSELSSVPDGKRGAHFRTVITCAIPDGAYFQAEGVCDGRILRKAQGGSGFGYDPLFYYEPLARTFAMLTADEKNAVSHRGIAMRKFAAELPAFLQGHGLL